MQLFVYYIHLYNLEYVMLKYFLWDFIVIEKKAHIQCLMQVTIGNKIVNGDRLVITNFLIKVNCERLYYYHGQDWNLFNTRNFYPSMFIYQYWLLIGLIKIPDQF